MKKWDKKRRWGLACMVLCVESLMIGYNAHTDLVRGAGAIIGVALFIVVITLMASSLDEPPQK